MDDLIDKKHAVNYLQTYLLRLTVILVKRLRAQTDRRWFRSYLLGCFVKCFYFVWSKPISACQKCPGEGASTAVPTWWSVSITKVGTGTVTRWRVVANGKVPTSSKNRSMRWAVPYGMRVTCIRRKFHRCPSWFVYQREKKCLGIFSIPGATAVTCWENKKRQESWYRS